MKTEIDQLIRWIREGSDAAMEALAKLEDVRVHDEHRLTPLNAAIRYGNKPVVDLLIGREGAVDYLPDLEKPELQLLRSITNSMETEPVGKIERFVAETFGMSADERYWMRSPMLEACRYGNRDAISSLIRYGASLSDRDALGVDPLRMCLDVGGTALASALLDACAENGRQVPISDEVLERLFAKPEFFDRLVRAGKLSAKAERFVFNLACSRLDVERVEEMLDSGHKPSQSIYAGRTPAAEAATSRLSWCLGDPAAEPLTATFRQALGTGEAQVFGADDLLKAIDDIEGWMAGGDEIVEEGPFSSPTQQAPINPRAQSGEIIERRLALIELLLRRGFRFASIRGDVDLDLLPDLVRTNEPRLLRTLADAGADLHLSMHRGEVGTAIGLGCFDMVEPLLGLGLALGKPDRHSEADYARYRDWQGRSALEAWGIRDDAEPAGKGLRLLDPFQAISESEWYWELGGESVLRAALLPDPPRAGSAAKIRLTHGNSYGPQGDVRFFIRLRDPESLPAPGNLEGNGDWLELDLLEQLVDWEGELLPIEKVDEAELTGEISWMGTFEVEMALPAGAHRIEIKVASPGSHPTGSGILVDWVVVAGA